MSLTSGRGPFSANRAGRFDKPVPEGVAYVEPFLRRVRGEREGVVVVDSERVLLVHRRGHAPNWVFPESDVAGVASTPEPLAPGYVAVAWDAVERWLEEDEPVLMHPRNPYHRVDCIKTTRRLRVEASGLELVETTDTIGVYETSLAPLLYVNRSHVAMEHLVPSPTTSYCPYKGHASYWTLRAPATQIADIAWTYEDPYPECHLIAGLLCFDAARIAVTTDLPQGVSL